MRVIPLFRIRPQSWWQNMVLEKRFGVTLFTFSHHPKQRRTDLFKTYRSCVELLYLKSFLVPYWSGLEWGQLQLSGHPMACWWRCSSKPCFCMRSKPLPSFTREPCNLDDNLHLNRLLSLLFLKLVPTHKEAQIPTQHVVTKTSERMREENIDGRKCMLLLYSKILCICKHLMIAYFEKVFLKKLMQLNTQIVLSSPSSACW